MLFEILSSEVVASFTHSQSHDWFQGSQFYIDQRPYCTNGLSDLHEIFTKHIGNKCTIITFVRVSY